MNILTDVSNAMNKVEWSFESHDPIWAWLIVGIHSLAALLCIRALLCSQRALFPKAIIKKCRIFWLFIFAVMLFLACNKQLDIQTYITAVGRELANTQGWYDQRRAVQREVIIVLGLVAFLFLSYLVFLSYNLPTSYKIVMAGALLTFTFIGMRASSFHHLDQYIAQTVFGVKLHILIEIAGSLIVCLGAFFSVRSIDKWELYYDTHYQENEGGGLIDTNFDIDSEDDSENDSEFDVVDIEGDWDAEDSLVVRDSVSKEALVVSKTKSSIADILKTDSERGNEEELVVEPSLFDKVSNPDLKASSPLITDNATPRISRKSLTEINRQRRELQKQVDLAGSSATGFKGGKDNRKDNWLSREDETGWI